MLKERDLDNSLTITIVMPCLNEEETLEACIEEALAAIQASGVAGEVLIADNGSTDGSRMIAEQAGARVVSVLQPGYGAALIGGIRDARGKFVLMGDADGSYDFSELPKYLEKLKEGNDLVMGCRLPRGGGTIEKGAMPWKHRWIGNPVLSALGQVFFRAPVKDFHCGLRAFNRRSILNLKLQCQGMEFASEMVVKSTMAGLKMAEIPITLRPDQRSRPPHLRSWRDGWRHLRFMLLFSPRWLFLYPGLLMFLAGAFGFALLTASPLTIGNVTFDTNTLLVCSVMITTGVQLLFFALFIQAYAIQMGLLAPDKRIEFIFNHSLVEWGIAIGLVFLLSGVIYMGSAFLYWKSSDFGALSYPDSLRVVIPSITAIAVGIQCIFSGFALAVLGLSNDKQVISNNG